MLLEVFVYIDDKDEMSSPKVLNHFQFIDQVLVSTLNLFFTRDFGTRIREEIKSNVRYDSPKQL